MQNFGFSSSNGTVFFFAFSVIYCYKQNIISSWTFGCTTKKRKKEKKKEKLGR